MVAFAPLLSAIEVFILVECIFRPDLRGKELNNRGLDAEGIDLHRPLHSHVNVRGKGLTSRN